MVDGENYIVHPKLKKSHIGTLIIGDKKPDRGIELAEAHWEYTKKVISIGMKIACIASLQNDGSDKSERDYQNIIECLEELYIESFKHGVKHGQEEFKA